MYDPRQKLRNPKIQCNNWLCQSNHLRMELYEPVWTNVDHYRPAWAQRMKQNHRYDILNDIIIYLLSIVCVQPRLRMRKHG